MAITWPVSTAKKPQLQPEQVGLALLPGSHEVFNPTSQQWESLRAGEPVHIAYLGCSGRIGSVTRASAQPRAAMQFLLWLSGPTLSGRIASQSEATTVFRTSHFRSAGAWQAPYPQPELSTYGELIASSHSFPRRLVVPRIPGSDEYVAALNTAVLAAVKEEQTPADALNSAAEAWHKISSSRAFSAQQQALRRSLGVTE